METMTLIILGIIAISVIYFIAVYNGFIALINRSKEAWSDIDVQLKRRYDLIPNLVETVKGYATHERELLEKVAEARSKAMQAQGLKEK
ncbi:MAG: LemA family protein, partial [Aminobacterium sp.]